MNRATTAYWIATGLFCAVLLFSGVSHLSRAEWMVEGMTHLGYPVYVMTILGIAKLLGVAALLIPGKPQLKEWTYAGFTFNLLGATASHGFAGDPLSEAIRPAILLIGCALSYFLRPASRRLAATASPHESRSALGVST